MDTLRNLFGNATATIFRLVVVAATIILVSIFIVKPALETTEKISGDVTRSSNNISRSIQQSVRQSVPNNVNRRTQRQLDRAQRQINRATRRTNQPGGASPAALLRCVQRANGNVNRIQACARRFQ